MATILQTPASATNIFKLDVIKNNDKKSHKNKFKHVVGNKYEMIMESILQLAMRKETDLASATDIVSLALRVWLFAICINKQNKDIPSIQKDIPSIYMHTPYYFCIFLIKTQKHVKYAHLPVRGLRVDRDLCI